MISMISQTTTAPLRSAGMAEEELKANLQAAVQDALGWRDGLVTRERARALDYYHGRPFGNEVEGRSQVVSSDVADVVEWILPSLMRIFAGGSEIARFEPVGPDDEVRDSLAPLRELPSIIDQQDGRLAVLEARGHKAAGVAVALGALGTGAVGLLGWVGSKVAWNKLIGGS